MMDPVALNILAYYPQPNQPGDPVTGRNNYYQTGTSTLDTNNTDVRVDRNFGTTGRGFARYSHRFVATRAAAGVSRRPDDRRRARDRGEPHAQLRDRVQPHDWTAPTLLTARLGFARTLFVFNNQGLGFVPSSLGLPTSIDDRRRSA